MGLPTVDIQLPQWIDAALADSLAVPLSQLCFEGPEEELRRTEIQQPAILTTSIALLRALEDPSLQLYAARA